MVFCPEIFIIISELIRDIQQCTWGIIWTQTERESTLCRWFSKTDLTHSTPIPLDSVPMINLARKGFNVRNVLDCCWPNVRRLSTDHCILLCMLMLGYYNNLLTNIDWLSKRGLVDIDHIFCFWVISFRIYFWLPPKVFTRLENYYSDIWLILPIYSPKINL